MMSNVMDYKWYQTLYSNSLHSYHYNSYMRSAAVAKKSASIVILRTRNHHVQVLLLKRKQGQDFGNTYSFPGGKLELDDVQYLQKNSSKHLDQKMALNKVAAIRELYEETGLLVNRKDKLTSKSSRFVDLHQEIEIEMINELVRIITPQQFKSRYDNQYFMMDQTSLMNVGLYKKSGQIEDLKNIDDLMIDKNESDQYMWIGLDECMSRYRTGDIKLSPPIAMIISSLSRLKTIQSIKSYVQSLNPTMLTFPYIPVLVKSQSQYIEFMMVGDHQFEKERLITKEVDNDLRNELASQYEWFEQKSKGCNRFRFKGDCMVGVEIKNQKYNQLFDLGNQQNASL